MRGSPDIKAQVFEVIVRQAMAGAPWREICAGPMAANGITADAVQAEVERRFNYYTSALSSEEKESLELFIQQWEKTEHLDCESAFERKEEIESLIRQLYESFGMAHPTVKIVRSPAAFVACINEINNRVNKTDLSSEELESLCQDQEPEFREALIKETANDFPSDLGEPKTTSFQFTLMADLRVQDSDTTSAARLEGCTSELAKLDMRRFFRTSFGNKIQPFQIRLASVTDVAVSQIPDSCLQFFGTFPVQGVFGSPAAVDQLRSQIWGLWSNSDILAFAFINETLLERHDVKYVDSKALSIYLALFKIASWVSFFENYCFVGTTPKETVLDARRRLSNEDGAAITYSDGYKVFAVNGMSTPRRFLENPDSITLADIDQESNIERRRGLLELYGLARYLSDSNATLVSKDDCGELYQIQIPNDEPLTMVKVINSTIEPDGTYKSYFLRVPPRMTTAREAVAWTFSIENPQEYNPTEES